MKTIIKNAIIVNEGRQQQASLTIEDGIITDIIQSQQQPEAPDANIIDASGCYVLPGVIDDHVHFREPGLTDKADMESESRAAAAGGVTTCFDMPNTMPQTTTMEALYEKQAIAAARCHVNHAFFFGATNSNMALFDHINPQTVPGIKLFMGSSTGNMLVDDYDQLLQIFSRATMPIMAHCEDTAVINRNIAAVKSRYGEQADISLHPQIRSEEACMKSTMLAVELAERTGARLHIAHITTAKELQYIRKKGLPNVTTEATVGHLWFCDTDYPRLGALIKVNPAIKTVTDRESLRRGLTNGDIDVIGTDHAPHLLSQKQGGCFQAASGMPMIQFSLPAMLELTDQGVLDITQLVQLMCHRPATLFNVKQRGFIRRGYKADLVIVKKNCPWKVTPDIIESKCGWSPMVGHTFRWKIQTTLCNGHPIYHQGRLDSNYTGEPVEFDRHP
ncbi:MAG: dihydroorotase [Prevotella sp.]